MSTITMRAGTDAGSPTTRRVHLWRVGFAAGLAAAATTSLTAVTATALGIELAIGGERIPTTGFAVLTLVGALLGIAIAKLAQRTDRPDRAFVGSTVALTAMSLIPDVVADATWGTRLLLGATHVIAAAIIIPALAARLHT